MGAGASLGAMDALRFVGFFHDVRESRNGAVSKRLCPTVLDESAAVTYQISFTDCALAGSQTHREQAEENLRHLLNGLPDSFRVNLDAIGVTFVFHAREDDSGPCIYADRTIELNLKEFRRASMSGDGKKRRADRRWALATLKEEIIHYLASHYRFDNSLSWLWLSFKELRTQNALRKRLRKKQRRYDSSRDEIKLSPKEYPKDAALIQSVFLFILARSWEPAEELLVDLLLVRDYLATTGETPDTVDKQMQVAFPHTYKAAKGFEQMLSDRAAGILAKQVSDAVSNADASAAAS